MKEVWAKIKDVEGYEVSNMGRVRSFWLNRYLKEKPQKYLKLCLANMGYYVVNLNRGNTRLVHRLVLETFTGETGEHCCHNNGIKTDNRLSNLRWDTAKGNAKDKDKHGTRWIGSKSKKSKLNKKVVRKMREEYATGKFSQRELAKKYGVSQTTAGDAINGTTWGDA